MNSVKVLIPVLAAAAFLGACTPFPEPPMGQQVFVPGPPPGPTISDADQQMIREQRRKAQEDARLAEQRRQAALSRTDALDNRIPDSSVTNPGGSTSNPGGGTDAVKPVEPKKEYPYATKVPGKDGFVLSPYNTKVIDVRDIPSGTLVQDPNYPASEKKYFRIP
jgi:hypothetical protein